MKVKRYMADSSEFMIEREDGDYVTYSDYQKLAESHAELIETLESIESMSASPQWRNEPLYRIAELTEAALDKANSWRIE